MKRENRLVSLVYLVVWFVWLNETNQMNKTDRMNQINASRPSHSAILRREPAILDPIWNRSSLTLQRLSPAPWPEAVR